MNKYKIGNDEGNIINDLEVKTKIINYLFNSLNLSSYRFKMLEKLEHLKFLKNNPHYVSPNFNGYNYFLIFTKINKSYYCVLIDKKKFSYHKEKLNIKLTKIIKIKIMTSSSMFNGSIFDCKLIKNRENYYLLIKDCYKLMGNDLVKMELLDKMNYLNNVLPNTIENNNYFDIKINKLFKYDELEKLINKVIPSSKLNVQGIIFYPIYSGISIIYTNVNKSTNKINITTNEKISNTTYTLITDIDKILKNRIYSYENDGKKDIFEMEKTEISDVYNLYKDQERIGIAHIPNIKISSYCRDIFQNDEKYNFKCVYNNNFKKWIPLERV